MKHYRRHSVIVGAGVMGCQLAYALCQQQEDVLLLEANRLEPSQLELNQLELNQSRSNQLETRQLQSNQLETRQLQSNQLKPYQLELNQLEAHQLELNQLEARQLQSNQLEAHQLELNQLEAHQLEACKLQSNQLEANQAINASHAHRQESATITSTVSSRASSLPLALINPLRGRSARLQAIDLAGLRALQQLEPHIRANAFMPTGVLRIASNKKQAKTWQKRLQEYATALELHWLEPRDVPSCYHAPFGALLIVEAGYVLPQQLLANVLNEAQHLGLEVWESARVQRLDSHTNTLYLKDSCIHAEHIFLCVGADKQGLQLVPDREILSTLERIAGEVMGINSKQESMPYALAGAIYGMQQGAQIYIGGNHRPADTVDPSAPQQLHKSASWFLPSLLDGRRSSSWTGVRCKAATPLPLIQSITPRLHFVGALAGRGFLCAAHIAQQVVREITS